MTMLTETVGAKEGIENLIDIAVALSDFTQTIERAREVPNFLSRALEVPRVSLAIVRQSRDDAEPHLVMLSSSGTQGGGVVTGGGAAGQGQGLSEAGMIAVYRRVKQLMREGDSALRTMWMSPVDGSMALVRENGEQQGSDGRQGGAIEQGGREEGMLVFAHAMDRSHLMCLLIGPRKEGAAEIAWTLGTLPAIARELFKQLQCLIAWQTSPWALGAPFDRLSRQEWTVLGSLDSDASEKQLAAQLNLRPHTLHSHIKSIYHKIGVQGRLPLLQTFHEALRRLRIEIRGVPHE